MTPDLLQQLRDIHLPAEAPGWWPPAPGWWLLAAMGLLVTVLALRALMQHLRRQRPVKHAARLYRELYRSYSAGELAAADYLHESNELLKRLMIYGLGVHAARSANGEPWLALLDAQARSDAFSRGPGRALGNQRFRAAPEADIAALHAVLERFFRSARA